MRVAGRTLRTTRNIVTLAFTAINPVKVLRRVTPSYFYPAPPPPAGKSTSASFSSSSSNNTAHTAKLSPTATILHQRAGLTFAEPINSPPRGAGAEAGTADPLAQHQHTSLPAQLPLCVQSAERKMQDKDRRRRRRSSSLMYQEPPESLEQQSDQATMPNLNSQWVNAKGAWMIHIVLILGLKILFSTLPHPLTPSQETSWTLTNVCYMAGSYLMFHYVRGVPFEFNAGAYDNLNMWEQIDNGDQYTPAKKFLMAVPICLFLVSTHYTRYGFGYFVVNLLATVAVVVPKLPALHRMRFSIFNPDSDADASDEHRR
ncbi:hypothetical protein LTR36_007917 [Oleoguttula mirabilis]|uniref:Protein ORM1 n=1 Tax=Oleoguttula mirabilis TaxID=1507867 RepID=A0AAV9J8P2_9PEZI|nr:hypothetical protein LTR36_007917 [Oleoguttula mirabilis]